MVFPVVMYGCESWTIKKAGHQRTDAFKLWYWTLESPLDFRETQRKSVLNFIERTDAEAEAPILWLPAGKHGLI